MLSSLPEAKAIPEFLTNNAVKSTAAIADFLKKRFHLIEDSPF
jgi:hypothetical protein